VGPIATFSPAELDYLRSERRLGRLATADADGHLHVVPVGMWSVNNDLGTIDITGHDFARKRKFRNVRANPRAALVVDDLASTDPWRPRSVMVEGPAQAIDASPETRGEGIIRIEPETTVSWGLEADDMRSTSGRASSDDP
jgi:pyridoxamine 5'-phosphate oxidase family protein